MPGPDGPKNWPSWFRGRSPAPPSRESRCPPGAARGVILDHLVQHAGGGAAQVQVAPGQHASGARDLGPVADQQVDRAGQSGPVGTGLAVDQQRCLQGLQQVDQLEQRRARRRPACVQAQIDKGHPQGVAGLALEQIGRMWRRTPQVQHGPDAARGHEAQAPGGGLVRSVDPRCDLVEVRPEVAQDAVVKKLIVPPRATPRRRGRDVPPQPVVQVPLEAVNPLEQTRNHACAAFRCRWSARFTRNRGGRKGAAPD
jgi:hypothetical protein